MKNKGSKTIETKNLILRKFEMEDAEAMYKNFASDADVTKFLTWQPYSSVEDAKEVLRNWIPQYENLDTYRWAITVKENGNEPIGSIDIVNSRFEIGKVEFGYCISKNWWHKGVTSEALKALIDFFIKEVGVNRIEATHDVKNVNSGKVMMKCGLKYEGTMRQASRNNQGICDISIYSLLAEEYNQ